MEVETKTIFLRVSPELAACIKSCARQEKQTINRWCSASLQIACDCAREEFESELTGIERPEPGA